MPGKVETPHLLQHSLSVSSTLCIHLLHLYRQHRRRISQPNLADAIIAKAVRVMAMTAYTNRIKVAMLQLSCYRP